MNPENKHDQLDQAHQMLKDAYSLYGESFANLMNGNITIIQSRKINKIAAKLNKKAAELIRDVANSDLSIDKG